MSMTTDDDTGELVDTYRLARERLDRGTELHQRASDLRELLNIAKRDFHFALMLDVRAMEREAASIALELAKRRRST